MVWSVVWLNSFLCVIFAIHLLTSNRMCWGNWSGVPRQKAFTSKARGFLDFFLILRNTIPGQYNVTVKTVLMWMPLWGYFHFLTDLSGDPDQFASNADSSYVSGKRHKGDLLLKWRNCVTLHLLEICGFYFMLTVIQIAFTSVPGKFLSHFWHFCYTGWLAN